MKLRRLNLSGFKTFARRSEIVFDRGITAVVGPNGSGKSNVVDAIRWSLGETNARELRGARMDEVIYAGGAKRARMNIAEVELVIDNTEGRIPVEDAEVSVSRRVVRGGDSEYRLNGDRVRLKDIERVLGATGLTQTGYSVVAQNDIDAIIQATPSQRRALVEQAAGVRSLRAASEDALDKINRAETTLLRLDDILDDAEPRLAELAGQAELAIEQRELSERLTELRGNLAREEWRAARGRLRQAKRRLESALGRAEAAAEAELAFSTRFESQRETVALARETQRNTLARLEAARLAAERAAGDARRWFDRQATAVVMRTTARVQAVAADAERAAARAELAELDGSGGSAAGAAEAAEQRLADARRHHEEALLASDAAIESLREAELELETVQAARDGAVASRREAAARVGMLAEALTALNGEATAMRDRVGAMTAEAAAAQARNDDATAHLGVSETAAQQAQQALESAQTAMRAGEASLTQFREVAQATVARAAMLRGQVDGSLDGVAGAVADAVTAGTIAGHRLYDCFEVSDAETAAAVEAALEHHLGAFVVSDVAAAWDLLAAEGGRESVLAASATARTPRVAPAGARRLLAGINILRPEATGALTSLLDSVWLVPDLNSAYHAVGEAGGCAVLRDGRLVTAAGVRGGGRPGRTLELAAEERSAAAAADAALAAERAAAAELFVRQQAVDAASAATAGAGATLQTARVAAAETSVLYDNCRAALDAEQHRLVSTEAAVSGRATELAAAEAFGAQAAAEADGVDAAVATARRLIEDRRERITELRTTTELSAAALREADAAAVETRLRSDDIERRLAAARAVEAAAAHRYTDAEMRLLIAESDAVTALMRSRAARAAAAEVTGGVDQARRDVEAAAPLLADAERLLAAIEVERSEVAIAVARAADERNASQAEVDLAQGQVNDLADAVRGDDEDEGPEPDAQAAEKAEREIVRLERRISALGPVNGLAPEQHAILAERVGTVRGARDDIGDASRDVRAIAALLGVEIERRFDAVFGAVGVNFQELFAELFPGGRATLRLEEVAPAAPRVADAADEAEEGDVDVPRVKLPGVEILAQPAGKRLQPLSLLSGGERALTALAMILALQQVNASPFYVFDEIDAPLDDANVLRLTRLLRRLAVDQQFIVVTHNHATMAAADILYGVTIDKDGVSSVLSVRLAAAEDMTEVDIPGRVQQTVPTPV